ncbi:MULTISPECIES: NAD-dependent epimerase/dehydratase family protein [Luteibacter]|uniref:NAD-dependent epimerase/dehydratase family protein n=1 Tax=Luteibacter TaxID=242605 RepID=UPI00055BBD2D|nr:MULTISPECIES: NAD-dependent epimerase/dehydratase family protein [unclassified Luteibacter]SKC01167.1 dolichol-phosphate mannosyltransferase [Luteibacter sp. 22Crub2.1]
MNDLNQHIRALHGPILVTGSAGFVGANLFRKILALRPDVYAVVQSSTNWRLEGVGEANLVEANVNDAAALRHLVEEICPRTVFDCVAYGAYSFEQDPRLIYETNFQSIVSLTTMLADRSISAYIHAGSSSEYGSNSAAPQEDARCEPNSHYAVSKVAAAEYLSYLGKERAFPCVNLRLYSVYGPLEDGSRLIPNLIYKALQGSLPPFVDPATSRDFVHVDDVCAAFIYAAAKMNPDLYGESLNIGSGRCTTIESLAAITRDVFGVTEEPRFGAMEGRSWDLADWFSDPTKAHDMLGWQAQISLEDGLRSTSGWVATLSEDELAQRSKKSTNRKRRSVSAIIACYKDEPAIPVMYRRLKDTFSRLGIDHEIIFVNDCSPDDSAAVIQAISASDPCVIGITHSRNFGSQMAFRSGMELASKDAVVLLDGDLQDPPELIEAFYAKWEEGFDVVYGRRVQREMPWHWGLLYKAFYRVFAAFSYVQIPLDAGDFSLIDRKVMQWLLDCPERDLFMRGLRAYVGFRQTGVDYVRPERMFGHTTNTLTKNIDWAKKGIFSFSNVPLTLLTTAGLGLLALSVVAAIVVATLRIVWPDIAPRGATTMLIAVLMFGSLNLFGIGLVGEYIGKIMLEVKQRPRLIRAALIRHGVITPQVARPSRTRSFDERSSG